MNGYDPYALSPDLYQQQMQAMRQQQIAEALAQQSVTPLQASQAGGFVVPVTPLQGLSKVAQALIASRTGKKAQTEMGRIQEKSATMRAQMLAAALSGDQDAAARLMAAGDPTISKLMQAQMEQANQPRLLMEGELPQGFQLPQGAQAYGTPGRITKLERGPQQARLMSAAEVRQAGLPTGTVAQIDGSGKVNVLRSPAAPEKPRVFSVDGRLVDERGNVIYQGTAPSGRDPRITGAPTGTMWVDPNDPAKGVEPIPGGPKDRATQATAQAAKAQNVLDIVNAASEMVDYGTAGFLGSKIANIAGTEATDLSEMLTTIKANIGFDTLQQMREASPTGGALGQVAVQELNALQSAVASLSQRQSPEQLKKNLERIRTHYTNWLTTVNKSGVDVPSSYGGWSIRKK